MKNFLLVLILGTLPFLATGKPILAITDSLGNRIYNLNAITIISNPKWDSKLFEFPGSISYLNTGNLDEMNIRSVKDISTIVPNLFIPDYGSKLISSAYIRGIGSRINSPAVGLYVNNVPYLDKSAFDFDFIDIASIEVLKGPQGTLYGTSRECTWDFAVVSIFPCHSSCIFSAFSFVVIGLPPLLFSSY